MFSFVIFRKLCFLVLQCTLSYNAEEIKIRAYFVRRISRCSINSLISSVLVKSLTIHTNYCAMCVRGYWDANPRPRSILRSTLLTEKNMLLLLLLKIKKNVTLLSQVRNNYSQRVWHGVFECIMIIMESAGSLEVSVLEHSRNWWSYTFRYICTSIEHVRKMCNLNSWKIFYFCKISLYIITKFAWLNYFTHNIFFTILTYLILL